ncbi:hypothetical protein M514_21050 [Trichuris suis]|uniref:Uncharacterized protein n=1 Tax=Trichuris suis TaxID=68888 RepID=A0A085NB55_9BILA|nr:hypothetical protein M514_21050 [Trichuris suis]KHJ41668.1 hypothetical protein D918_08198 [Trichuris suis]
MTEGQTSHGTEDTSEESVELARGLSASFEAGSVNLLKLSVGEDVFPKLQETTCSDLNLSCAEKRRDGAMVSRIDEQTTNGPPTPYLSKVSTPVCGAVFNVDFPLKLPLSDIESFTDDGSGIFGVQPQSRYVISEEWVHETTEDFGTNCSVISGSMHLTKFRRSNCSPITGSTHLPELARSSSLPTLRRPCRQTCRRRTKSV